MKLQIEKINSIVNINEQMLAIKELLITLNYDYNTLYIDKFWDNIKDDNWIYIDNDMIEWIG